MTNLNVAQINLTKIVPSYWSEFDELFFLTKMPDILQILQDSNRKNTKNDKA
jgi:hypothetical protein